MCGGDERTALHRLGSTGVVVTMVPSVLGCASDFWLKAENGSHHEGLWRLGDGDGSLHGAIVAARGLASLALCLHCASVLTGMCCSRVYTGEFFKFSCLPRLEEVTALLSAGLMGACVAAFCVWSRTVPAFLRLSFDWSFYLYFSATCFLLLFGGLIAFAREREICEDLKQRKTTSWL